jgi:hypothetical protein
MLAALFHGGWDAVAAAFAIDCFVLDCEFCFKEAAQESVRFLDQGQ